MLPDLLGLRKSKIVLEHIKDEIKKLTGDEMDFDKVKDICRIGQGEECCRYLVCGSDGFECGKLNHSIKAAIDKRNDMVAKADNCSCPHDGEPII